MKPKLLSPLAILLLCTTLFSCKDKTEDEVNPEVSRQQLITGNWTVLFAAFDDNENGTIEEDEKEFPDLGVELNIAFYSDGNGKTISKDPTSTPQVEENTFKWSLLNNGFELLIIDEYTYFNGTDSVTQKDTTNSIIKELSAESLMLENRYVDTFGGITTTETDWIALRRQ